MLKRKRDENIEAEISQIDNQAIRVKASRLRARFEHGVTQLTAQLKLARGFDRQKMTRRVKQAGSDKEKLERLQAEVLVLGKLHEGKLARNYLLKQCVRTKRINEAEAFQSLFGKDAMSKVKGAVSLEEGNVHGRLFKSNVVSDVLPGIMKGIREVLGVDRPVNRDTKDAEMGSAAVSKYNDLMNVEDTESHFEGFSDSSKIVIGADGHESDDEFECDRQSLEDKQVPGDTIEQSMNEHNSRLAGSSDEDDDSTLGQSHDRPLDDMEITSDEEDVSEDDGDLLKTGSESEDEQPILEVQRVSAPTQTSFLPSLMHGGYYSGSDSDAEDAEKGYDPDKAFPIAQPRKNRRGQRERQAIAEKKFGTKAKHLLKANGTERVHGERQKLVSNGNPRVAIQRVKNDGWDMKRGAVDASSRVRSGARAVKPPNRSERRKAGGRSTGANAEAVMATPRPQKRASANDKLHASWEAAKKRKQENQNAAFAGSKITFD